MPVGIRCISGRNASKNTVIDAFWNLEGNFWEILEDIPKNRISEHIQKETLAEFLEKFLWENV